MYPYVNVLLLEENRSKRGPLQDAGIYQGNGVAEVIGLDTSQPLRYTVKPEISPKGIFTRPALA